MALIQEIQSNQTTTENIISVVDLSVYSTPTVRGDYGIALIVKIDAGNGTYEEDVTSNDLSNPGTDDTNGEWEIGITNTRKNYEIIAYWCPLWKTGITYTTNQIVYYENNFYVAGQSTTEEPGTGTEWILIDENDELSLLFAEADNLESSTVYESVFPHADYEVVLLECNGNRRLYDYSENGYLKRYTVINYREDEVVIEATEFSTEYVDFTLSADGVYRITIEQNSLNNFELEEYTTTVADIPIYEYCHLKECYTYLVKSVLCNDYDPCCDNCDADVIAKKNRQRQVLNQMIALYPLLLASINEEYVTYFGIFDIDETRDTMAEQIDLIFEKIEDILERCELCQGAWQVLTTNTTNTSGSYKPCNC